MLGKLSISLISFIIAGVAMADDQLSLAQEPVITLPIAERMVDGCKAFALEHNLDPLAIAIYDAGGNEKLFVRQDGTPLVAAELVHLKARTSAVINMDTGALGDDVEFANAERPLGLRYIDGLTMVQGGVAIRTESGTLLGGIGVSGAPSEMDEACAKAGIDAVRDALK